MVFVFHLVYAGPWDFLRLLSPTNWHLDSGLDEFVCGHEIRSILVGNIGIEGIPSCYCNEIDAARRLGAVEGRC